MLTILACLLPILAVAPATTFPASTVAYDDCNGCQLGDDEDTDSAVCDGCTATIWSEVSNFDETCGNFGVTCSAARCSYTWKVKFKAEGDCTEITWQVKSCESQTGTPFSGETSTTLITQQNLDYICSQKEPWCWHAISACGGNPAEAKIEGDHGCSTCSGIGGT